MKKVLYIHQYFKTPKEPGGTRSYWISKALINAGYQVTMITGRNEQIDEITRENIDGIEVIYIRNAYDNSFGILKRLKSFVRFMQLAYKEAKKEPDINLVYATSTPLTIGIPALRLLKRRKIPYIFEVRDLWPEVPIQMGALKNPIFRFLAIWLEKKIYKNASHIIALSPGMQEGVVAKGVDKNNVSIVPNMSKIDEFYFRDKNAELMKRLDLSDDKFYVIHFGAIGLTNGVDYIVETANILHKQKESSIEFLFAGGGNQEHVMKRLCEKYQLNNVKFLGKFQMLEMSELVNIADCSIVSFADIPILQTNSPNKLFDSLSAQKPIIVNSAGWTKELVEKNKCGTYVDPKKPEDLATLLINWKDEKNLLHEMGKNSRKLAETIYDKKHLTKQIVNIIEQTLIN